jgi:hypothetical protein
MKSLRPVGPADDKKPLENATPRGRPPIKQTIIHPFESNINIPEGFYLKSADNPGDSFYPPVIGLDQSGAI